MLLKGRYIILVASLALLVFLTLNKHRNSGLYNYHSEIFSDKAGYYIYLPSVFIYEFNASNFPDSIEFKTGEGFTLNRQTGIIQTKYPYGVALLEAPFFGATHLYCNIINPSSATGFSRPYHQAINLAAVFYLLLGLFAAYRFLCSSFTPNVSAIAIIVYLLSSNLIYYGIDETGLSHVYSFFAVSVFLYFTQKFQSVKTYQSLIFSAISAGLIVAIRPINILFIPALFLFSTNNVNPLKNKSALIAITLGIIAFVIPQLLYYYYLSGSPVLYSYKNESFIYLFSPKIKEVLFAFENGWLSNNPIHIISIVSMFLMTSVHKLRASMALLLLIGVTYLYASWWSWKLGCGLGHRGYVDFYPILMFSFAFFIENYINSKWSKSLFYGSVILLLLLNMKLVYTYDGCWYGKGSWDIQEYIRLITSSTK